MEFCECGTMILKPGACSSCGKDNKNSKGTNLDFNKEIKKENEIQDEFVVLDKEDWSIHPIVDKECNKCGNQKARYFTRQTRAADEDETEFYRCESCKYKWRNY